MLDLLIVGGGIVGAGIARDAAMRGMRVMLVEQRDFASGTSSRSSRLLHGGLRYLAQGRVGLVREAGREKQILRRIAPHLYRPLPFTFPTLPSGPWRRWKLGLGVRIYHLLCGGERPRVLSRDALLSQVEPLRRDRDWTGGVVYEDAQTSDARLVLDTLRSAELAGAELRSYTQLVGASRDGVGWRCQLARHEPWVSAEENAEESGEEEVAARCVVHATGPWMERLPESRTQLRLTKGVHLVISAERLPLTSAVVMSEGDRILFALPWGERVVLGTTDTDYRGPLEEPPCEPEDIEYILRIANDTFDASLASEDVTATWAGIRPLLASPGAAGKPSDTSRRHRIIAGDTGWWDVAGGKLTTYREMAEEAVDRVASQLGRRFPPCSTATTPLLERESAAHSGWLPPVVSRSVVEHCCRHEWTRHLDDLMIRRTAWHTYLHSPYETATQAAAWMAELLEWSDQQREQQLSAYRDVSNRGSSGVGL
ncbi:MAG: glycerol-3-phosphate dehydrogenase/oxidase [Planctomycetales bacterium]|nr:glycerol-3-phosphate dehydrogenase/oxidase [Planctomycetales bacterium]